MRKEGKEEGTEEGTYKVTEGVYGKEGRKEGGGGGVTTRDVHYR